MTDEKMCKGCDFFTILEVPMLPFFFGRARCKKHDLVVDYSSKRKLNGLKCVEQEVQE